MKQGGLGCRVFSSLLVICYLEVVLWTSCLFLCGAAPVAGGAASSHDYLLRETVNLKLVSGDSQAPALCPDRAEAVRQADLQRCLESLSLLRRREFVQPATPTVLQQAIVGLSNLPVSNGLPAPFTGVKGIA